MAFLSITMAREDSFRVADHPPGTGTNGPDERIGLKSSTGKGATLIPSTITLY